MMTTLLAHGQPPRVAELIRAADAARRARAVRRSPAWPAAFATALRTSLRGPEASTARAVCCA